MNNYQNLDTNQKIMDLAARMQLAFVSGKRNNGTEFVYLADYRADWMFEVIRDVHGNYFPDDHIYDFVARAITAIAEYYDYEVEDSLYGIEADIYNADLMNWLKLAPDSYDYMDSVVNNGLVDMHDYSFLSHVQMAQYEHIQEVARAVFEALSELSNDEDFDPNPTIEYYNADDTLDEYYQTWVNYVIDNPTDFECTEDYFDAESRAILSEYTV